MKNTRWLRRTAFVLFLVGIALSAGTTGSAQSVFERAKRAAEEAAKRTKEKQQQQPPPQTGTPATPAPATPQTPTAGAPQAPAAGGNTSQPVTADDLLQSAPAANVVVNPKVMPDVVGIHLAQPARDAEGSLRSQYAKGEYRAWTEPLPPIPVPVVLGYTINSNAVGAAGNEQIAVEITPPPNPQVVWRVNRFMNRIHVNRATLLASLREKYGKESIAFSLNIDYPAKNDKEIQLMYWLIDERGAHVAAPRSAKTLSDCGFYAPQQGVKPDPQLFRGEASTDAVFQDKWNSTSCIGTIVNIQADQGRDPDIIESMYATVVDVPLYLRSTSATAAAWKAAADKARQQDLEKSKQAKPKL